MANLASPPENSRSNDVLVLYLKKNSKYLVKAKTYSRYHYHSNKDE